MATAIYHQHKTVSTKVKLKQSAVNVFFLQFAVNRLCVLLPTLTWLSILSPGSVA